MNASVITAKLDQWIGAACNSLTSNQAYLESAVELALVIVNRLCLLSQEEIASSLLTAQSNSAGVTSFSSVQVQDLISENLIIYLECPTIHTVRDLSSARVSIKAVDFQRSPDSTALAALLAAATSASGLLPTQSLNSPAAFHALGKIFLEIFSKGKSRSWQHFLVDRQGIDLSTSQAATSLLASINSHGLNLPSAANNNYALHSAAASSPSSAGFATYSSSNASANSSSNGYAQIDITSSGKRSFQEVTNNNSGHHDGHWSNRNPESFSYTDSQSTSSRAREFLLDLGVPNSICRLVSDLLDCSAINSGHNSSHINDSTIFTSLEQVQSDLIQMNGQPKCFLFDRMSQDEALEHFSLLKNSLEEKVLYGREKELETLTKVVEKVMSSHSTSMAVSSTDLTDSGHSTFVAAASHINGSRNESSSELPSNLNANDTSHGDVSPNPMFRLVPPQVCFISGKPGTGKTSLMRRVLQSCKLKNWIVIDCKFRRNMSSLTALAKSFDDLFRQFDVREFGPFGASNILLKTSFEQISRAITSCIDKEGLKKLSDLIPSLSLVHSEWIASAHEGSTLSQDPTGMQQSSEELSSKMMSLDKVGSGRNRLHYLFHLLVKSLCYGNQHVLIALDDLHLADSLTAEVIGKFIETEGEPSTKSPSASSCRGGLLVLGSFLDDEIGMTDDNIKQINLLGLAAGDANVTKINISDLTRQDVNHILSFNLGLPMRVTTKLADLTHNKTGGNVLFIIEFLKSLIKSKALEYSIRSRRWTWDEDSIDLQSITDGVSGLLSRKISQIPNKFDVEMLKVAACVGSQIEESTIRLLNSDDAVVDMMKALDFAVQEGLMEKAGPVYTFSNDMVQQTIYDLMSAEGKRELHKSIGMSLIRHSDSRDKSKASLLAVDQINICQDDANEAILSTEERTHFSRLNLDAGKQSMAMSNFEQSRSYIEAGIAFLGENHWQTQYSLTLELYEMSAVLSVMDGKIETSLIRLDDIIENVRSFQDSLNARALQAKFLAASGKIVEASNVCLTVLSVLGEKFQEDAPLELVLRELDIARISLKDISKEWILSFPDMTDVSRLNSMKFMSLLLTFAIVCKPFLIPLLGCRMVQISLQHGICNDTVIGLCPFSISLASIAGDIENGYRIGKVAEALADIMTDGRLRLELITVLEGYLKLFVEPMQSAVDCAIGLYNQGMLNGDIEGALSCGVMYAVGGLYTGTNLKELCSNSSVFLQKMSKHQQNRFLYTTMSSFLASTELTGGDFSGLDLTVKSYEELQRIGQNTNNAMLLWQITMDQLAVKFWYREYIEVVTLAERYQSTTFKRALEIIRVFYEGIAALCLARQSKQAKWRAIGEDCVRTMSLLRRHSAWNFENKLFLLRAELHYLNKDNDMAEFAYEASILAACEHNMIHEEALAYELYGIFCVENSLPRKGLAYLLKAQQKYILWGAMKKVEAVKFFIDMVLPSCDLAHE